MLSLEIYGLGVEIDFARREDEEEVARLLRIFLRERIEKVDLHINYIKKELAQEIGSLLFPSLAEVGIWAIHAGGFHFKGGHLIIGPSHCGKSTLTYMALMNGLSVVSDDIALLRESEYGIEILPFFSVIFLKDRAIAPEPERFKPGILRYLLFPNITNGSTFVKRIEGKGEVLRNVVSNFMWSYDREIQGRQKRFLERLCNYPGFEIFWGIELYNDTSIFMRVLNEIVQG